MERQAVRVRLAAPPDVVLQLNGERGDANWMVRVAVDGTVTFGDAYDPSEAARTFWTHMASTMRRWWLDRTPEAEVLAAAKALPLEDLRAAVHAHARVHGSGVPELAALTRLQRALWAVDVGPGAEASPRR